MEPEGPIVVLGSYDSVNLPAEASQLGGKSGVRPPAIAGFLVVAPGELPLLRAQFEDRKAVALGVPDLQPVPSGGEILYF